LARPFERVFVLVLLGWLLVARTALTVTSDPTQYDSGAAVWWPALIPSRGLSQPAASIFGLGVALLAVVFLVLIGLRLRRTRGLDRRLLLPVIVAGVAVGAVAGVDALTRLLPHNQPLRTQILTVEPIMMSTIPFAFLIAAVGRRLARAAVADLVLHVGASGTVKVVRAGLRQALRDPTLEVRYWVPEAGSYVDADGHPVNLEAVATNRVVVPVETADRQPLAAVVGDPSLARHHDVVDAAVAASRLALENARLQARVLRQLEQVRASRARIVEAGLAERRRLERDLHDGAQQRLLALAMQLAALRAYTHDPAALTAVEQACDELSRALQELRDLARGIHPAVLTQAGLAAALEGVVERLPLPVQLDVPAQRWDPAVESTAYFVACEALANIVKHAAASRARVTVRPQGPELSVEVADDGRGGADLTVASGLAGLQDRVAALGGRLSVTSPARAGTLVVASIPCG
jgi:signal transduction histidine kinase